MDHDQIAFLLNLNQQQSALFTSQQHERRRYRAEHPTQVGALKCMDGRIHMPSLTQTPLGIWKPFRSMGGYFDFGWPAFQAVFQNWVEHAISLGSHCLLLVTYHFASGDVHRGCRGFDYNVDAARKFTAELTSKLNRQIFCGGVVHAVECGIDTDYESLILHGEQGQTWDLSTVALESCRARNRLQELFPSIPLPVIDDFVPHIEGNLRHIAEIRAENRPVEEAVHKESVLAIGRGFDWLHVPNLALIVGPYPPNLDHSIVTAANLLLDNIRHSRINGDKVVLMSCAPFRDYGYIKEMAKRKAQFLAGFARNCIEERVPDLIEHLVQLTAILDEHTRLIEPVG